MQVAKVNKIKLTKRIVENAVVNPFKRALLWDTEITGLCVRIYPSGKKTYFLQYRNKNRETHKVKIGVHGTITTELAREQAVKLSLNISVGEDPSVKIVSENKGQSMQDLAEQYLSLHAKLKKA